MISVLVSSSNDIDGTGVEVSEHGSEIIAEMRRAEQTTRVHRNPPVHTREENGKKRRVDNRVTMDFTNR
jgi:hypothetical protein